MESVSIITAISQLENIEAIKRRPWNAAYPLRANSNYASNEDFVTVMGHLAAMNTEMTG
jgi:hypothetical protein